MTAAETVARLIAQESAYLDAQLAPMLREVEDAARGFEQESVRGIVDAFRAKLAAIRREQVDKLEAALRKGANLLN